MKKSRLIQIIKEEIYIFKQIDEMKVGDTVYIKNDKKSGTIKHIHHNQYKATVEFNNGLEKTVSIRDLTVEGDVKLDEILNEEEYDYWRDYQSGAIDRVTYNRLSKQFQDRNKSFTRQRSRARQTGQPVYLDISFREKDNLKSKHGNPLRWDSDKKSWYYLLQRGEELPTDLEKRKNKKYN